MLKTVLHNTLFDTYPVVLHLTSVWDLRERKHLAEALFSKLEGGCARRGTEFTILLVSTSVGEPYVMRSLSRWTGAKILRRGEPQEGRWDSNRNKVYLMRKAIKEVKTQYVISLDAFDTIVCGDLSRSLDCLDRIGCEMLCNGCETMFPDYPETRRFEEQVLGKERGYPYLNSGVFVAKTSFFREILPDLEHICRTATEFPRSDQIAYNELYKRLYPRIRVDHRCEVFQVVGMRDEYIRQRLQVVLRKQGAPND